MITNIQNKNSINTASLSLNNVTQTLREVIHVETYPTEKFVKWLEDKHGSAIFTRLYENMNSSSPNETNT